MVIRYHNDNNDFWQAVSVLLSLYIVYLLVLYFTNKANFWKWLGYGFAVIISLIIGVFGWNKFKLWKRQQKIINIVKQIHETGQEEYIKNFINRFGFEGKKGKSWSFRNHMFDWDRIDDLENFLIEKGIKLRTDDGHRDIFVVLERYIQEKEEKLTRESIHAESQSLAELTGADFEILLVKLFEAMGYIVQHTGKSGDQGGDLVANKDGDRVLIQAKRWKGAVGNEAVQQAIGAKGYYDCNKAMVVAAANFTREAIELAKVNNVELVTKERLQELLSRYLKESWS